MTTLTDLKVKIFADGADIAGMLEMYAKPYIKGFTTNPTLIRKAGVTDFQGFAREVLSIIRDRPISFEVFADDFAGMEAEAEEMAAWGPNVYVKIPITNTSGESSAPLLRRLSAKGIKTNVTALLAVDQVRDVCAALEGGPPALVSIFAGRVADTGRDPVPLMRKALGVMANCPNAELIWASPRELFNVFQANAIGCHIITVTNDILAKLALVGKDLHEYSLETVQMFYNDARKAGYGIHTPVVA